MPESTETPALDAFIAATKDKGASDEFLAALLVRRGWPADHVYSALGQYWSRATGMPIPQRTAPGESARDAFLYLLAFITLGIWAAAFGALLFQFIEHWVPDPVSTNYVLDFRSIVSWNLAALAVAFPIYLVVMRLIFREAKKNPERLHSAVRRWLTYIALLATAGTMIGDLIAFLGYFLLGELTERFVLKAAVVMLICGAIFAYYIVSLRWSRTTDISRQRSRNLVYAAAASAAVVATFITGLALAGMPAEQRRLGADRRRVTDLRAIAQAVHLWHDRALADTTLPGLPASLPELRQRQYVRTTTDPETGASYEYHPKTGTTYELCAAFSFDGQDASSAWNHGPGRTCFPLDAAKGVPYY